MLVLVDISVTVFQVNIYWITNFSNLLLNRIIKHIVSHSNKMVDSVQGCNYVFMHSTTG